MSLSHTVLRGARRATTTTGYRPTTIIPTTVSPAPTTTCNKRTYATQPPGNPLLEVFNRRAKRLQKERAGLDVEESRKVEYLRDEVAMRLCERLLASTFSSHIIITICPRHK